MKCEVVRDLLPLYIDKLTSEESNKEIEKHCWKVRGGFEEAMKNYCTLKELGYKFEEYE